MFMMVEVRKSLERNKMESVYPIIKFYCDWCVHIKKDRLNNSVKKILVDLSNTILTEKTGFKNILNSWEDIINFNSLRIQLQNFFREIKIEQNITEIDSNWKEFTKTLVELIADQPLIVNEEFEGNVIKGIYYSQRERHEVRCNIRYIKSIQYQDEVWQKNYMS